MEHVLLFERVSAELSFGCHLFVVSGVSAGLEALAGLRCPAVCLLLERESPAILRGKKSVREGKRGHVLIIKIVSAEEKPDKENCCEAANSFLSCIVPCLV